MKSDHSIKSQAKRISKLVILPIFFLGLVPSLSLAASVNDHYSVIVCENRDGDNLASAVDGAHGSTSVEWTWTGGGPVGENGGVEPTSYHWEARVVYDLMDDDGGAVKRITLTVVFNGAGGIESWTTTDMGGDGGIRRVAGKITNFVVVF